MKKFDVKSLAAGIIIGTMGVTTVFAASGIQSANLSNTTVTLNGVSLPLSKSLVSVTMDNEQSASLYVPANELLANLGYSVNYDSNKNTLDLIPQSNTSHETADGITSVSYTHLLTTSVQRRKRWETGVNIAIVDDSKKDAALLKGYVEQFCAEQEEAVQIFVYRDGLDFLDEMGKNFDIVFMDVEMPHLNGIQTAREMRKTDETTVLVLSLIHI